MLFLLSFQQLENPQKLLFDWRKPPCVRFLVTWGKKNWLRKEHLFAPNRILLPKEAL
jgi:hypothetical protein